MKNVHLIPTDKPSKLYYWEGKLRLGDLTTAPKNLGISNQNIYITSDEEIKGEDWCLDIELNIVHNNLAITSNSKKIILTDNKDLIKDGVQAIDDDFLEWFVKNPSCESVEVHKVDYILKNYDYKIIIPKEEPNQVGIDWSGFPKSTQEKVGYVEPKQETLEEAARNYAIKKRERKHLSNREFDLCQKDFIVGAKWQQERMYSEEDLKEAFKSGRMVKNYKAEWEETYSDEMTSCKYEDFKQWFEQFKKK